MSDQLGRVEPAPKNILLAGATGYIGRFVARELTRRGYTVVALARPAPDRTVASLSADLPGCDVLIASFNDADALKRSIKEKKSMRLCRASPHATARPTMHGESIMTQTASYSTSQMN